MGPKPEQPSPEVPRSAFGARTRCGDACDAWARPPRTQPPHDCSAVAQTRRRARPARLRGLPDADHAHLHATDHTRHAQHPVNSALLANSELSARLQCPRTRRDGRDCIEPQLSAPPRRRRVVRNDAPRDDDEADDAPRPGAADDGGAGLWARIKDAGHLYSRPGPLKIRCGRLGKKSSGPHRESSQESQEDRKEPHVGR